ncbi:uncharacterized protein [Aegilops tauschii subsp. strangulata]|uniref:uncharacterized protein n=1 Tax=Aegilops tauschii subsp. strangulata TaxID=200361 RepID=UPI003CC8783A
MQRQTQLRDVQKFTWCLASLSRFISRHCEKALPLYQLMKKTTCFEWTDQVDEAFVQLKRMLSMPPFLATPTSKEPMFLYITASSRVVSTVIVVEHPEDRKAQPVQMALYYLSESSGDWDAKDANMASYRFVQQINEHFDECEFLHVPRADNEPADALALIGSTRQAIPASVSLQCLCKPSIKPSPESEYIFVSADPVAVGSGLGTSAIDAGTSACDLGTAALDPGPGTSEPGPGTAAVGPWTSTTQQAAAGSDPSPPNQTALVPVAVMTVVEAPSWAQTILNFLVSRELPADEILARQVQRRSPAYTIVNGELVRHNVTGVFQRCVETEKGMSILRDIRQGECGHHAASRSLVAKAFCHGFFWPTALDDTKELARKFKGCQRFSSKQHLPASALKTIPITWPFAVWGLDMVGPFKITCGGMTLLLGVVDKFVKRIKARPIKKLNSPTVVTFIAEITVRASEWT